MVTLERQLFTEVFPIEVDDLPPIHGYRLVMREGDAHKVGGKLAYRLRRQLPGTWVWAGGRLLTDIPADTQRLKAAVEAITREQPKVYAKLAAVEAETGWQPGADDVADFVLRGPLEEMGGLMREALGRTAFSVRNARVEREQRIRPWIVNGQPALSFSVASQLIYDVDLSTYARSLDKLDELAGVVVTDKTSTMHGQIVKVVGPMSAHRDRLLGLTQREQMRDLLRNAPDDEVVVKVSSGANEYDYAASALQVLVGLNDARRFGLDVQHAARALRLKPTLRAQMVKIVADIAKAQRLIGSSFSTQTTPEPFTNMGQPPMMVFGGNRSRPYDVDCVADDFTNYGQYWTRERFDKEPVRVAILNALDEPVTDFMEALRRLISKTYGFDIEVLRERKVKVLSQSNLESAVRVLQKEPVDVVLAFIQNDDEDEDDEGADDQYIKFQTIGRGLPCLVIHESTFNRPEAMPQIVMGLLARAGNVPYLFDEPLEYADYVVGLDVTRNRKGNVEMLSGVARIYRNDGALMGYLIASAPVGKGEGIPADVLAALFPDDLFAGTRVVIHNDGQLKRVEMQALRQREAELDAQFHAVEIIRRGTPRIYALEGGKISGPPRGTTFILNDSEAFVVTANAPDDATPQPIHVRAESGLPIEQALHSVMMFTYLHYGALKTPKLPVTVHHAEYIRSSIGRGVLPENTSGELPFWL